jgi:hypothetical protein
METTGQLHTCVTVPHTDLTGDFSGPRNILDMVVKINSQCSYWDLNPSLPSIASHFNDSAIMA